VGNKNNIVLIKNKLFFAKNSCFVKYLIVEIRKTINTDPKTKKKWLI